MPYDLSSPEQFSSRRTDSAWLADLRGENGPIMQSRVHDDLSFYLIVVIFNNLRRRADTDRQLADFSPQDLTELAHDFAQDTLEKVTRNQYALLDKYSGDGAFTTWIAQVAHRIVASELRRPYWQRRVTFSEEGADIDAFFERSVDFTSADPAMGDPEARMLQHEVGEMLMACIADLSEHYRTVFLRCISDEERADVVADEMETTANAIYLIVFRAKRQLRKCLKSKGFAP